MLLLLSSLLASFAAAALGDEPVATIVPEADTSAFHDPVAISHRAEEAASLLAGVRTALDTELSTADRRRLGRKVLSESRIRIARGAFPAGGAAIVTINIELRQSDPVAEPRFLSGVLTLDAGGALATVVVPPRMQAERYEVTSIGDVDGDAHDDLLLTISKANTSAQHLVTWNDGQPEDRIFVAPQAP